MVKKIFWAGYLLVKQGASRIIKLLNMSLLRTISIVITYNCNSKCLMCDIWKIKKKHRDISFQQIKKIIRNKNLKWIKNIVLTGGEPFMRKDIFKIYRFIRNYYPNKRIIISTNGLLKTEIINFLNKTGSDSKLSLIMSINSIKKNVIMTGIKNSNTSQLEIMEYIKKFHPSIKIIFKFTITPWNYDELIPVYELAEKYNLRFLIKLIENLENYVTILTFNKNKKRFTFSKKGKKIILKELKNIRNAQLKNNYFKDSAFTTELIHYLTKNKYKFTGCSLQFCSLFIMQNGDAYLCRKYGSIGNIYHQGLDEIWNSQRAYQIRKSKCQKCISHYGFYNSLI